MNWLVVESHTKNMFGGCWWSQLESSFQDGNRVYKMLEATNQWMAYPLVSQHSYGKWSMYSLDEVLIQNRDYQLLC